MTEILDDIDLKQSSNTVGWKQVGAFSIIYLFALVPMGWVKLNLIRALRETSVSEVLISYILIFFLLVFFIRFSANYLNKHSSDISVIKLVLTLSTSIFIGELLYRNLQNYFLQNYGNIGESISYDYVNSIIIPIGASILGGLIAWSRLNKLRNKSELIPNLITAGIFFIFYFAISLN